MNTLPELFFICHCKDGLKPDVKEVYEKLSPMEKLNIREHVKCPDCEGRGAILTADGRHVLELIQRFVH